MKYTMNIGHKHYNVCKVAAALKHAMRANCLMIQGYWSKEKSWGVTDNILALHFHISMNRAFTANADGKDMKWPFLCNVYSNIKNQL